MFLWYSFIGGQNIHLHNFYIHQMIDNRLKFDELESPKPIPTSFSRQTIHKSPYISAKNEILGIFFRYKCLPIGMLRPNIIFIYWVWKSLNFFAYIPSWNTNFPLFLDLVVQPNCSPTCKPSPPKLDLSPGGPGRGQLTAHPTMRWERPLSRVCNPFPSTGFPGLGGPRDCTPPRGASVDTAVCVYPYRMADQWELSMTLQTQPVLGNRKLLWSALVQAKSVQTA
jgi:hypothetical protein